MTITFRASTAAPASSDTVAPFGDQSWTLPAGHTTDDLLIAFAGWKPYTTTIGTPSGYASEIGPITSGTTAAAANVGSVAAQAFTKTHGGSESAPSTSFSDLYQPFMGAMVALEKTEAGAWTVDSTSGTSETTTLNVTGAGSLAWGAGDMAVVLVYHKNDAATHASAALSASGVTFANLTKQVDNLTTSGFDGYIYVYTADVTVGATAAPNFTATVGASEGWATVLFLRVAEPGPVTGSSSATLGAATSSASGSFAPLAVSGTATLALAPATSSASGAFAPQAVVGAVSTALAAATSTASGTFTPLPVTGAVAATTAANWSTASGTTTPPPVTGATAVTLTDATPAASGTFTPEPVTGVSARTLTAAAGSASATFTPLPVTGTVGVSLAPSTSSGAGFVGTQYTHWRFIDGKPGTDRDPTGRRPDRALTGKRPL